MCHPTPLRSVPHCCLQSPGHHCQLWLLAGGLPQHSHHPSGSSMGASRGPLLLLSDSSLSAGCRELQEASTPTLCAPTSTAGLWKRPWSSHSISSFPF